MGREIKSLEEILEEKANQKPSDLRASKGKESFFGEIKNSVQGHIAAKKALREVEKAEAERARKENAERARKAAEKAQKETKTPHKDVATNSGDDIFEHILNVFFNFKNTCPDKIVSLSIYPSKRESGYGDYEISFILDGEIAWYPSNEANEMLQLFEMIKDDGSFQVYKCIYNTLERSSNYADIDQKLKSSVKLYMKKNPHIKFDLSGTGAKIKYW